MTAPFVHMPGCDRDDKISLMRTCERCWSRMCAEADAPCGHEGWIRPELYAADLYEWNIRRDALQAKLDAVVEAGRTMMGVCSFEPRADNNSADLSDFVRAIEGFRTALDAARGEK